MQVRPTKDLSWKFIIQLLNSFIKNYGPKIYEDSIIQSMVMRETTERPEAVDAGTVKLVGTDKEKIVAEASKLFEDGTVFRQMSDAHNPYGDGNAAERIVNFIDKSS